MGISNNILTEITTGTAFEGEFVSILSSYLKKNGNERYFRKTMGYDEDKFAGTDVICMGIPMDVTHHFAGKNHTIVYQQFNIDCGLFTLQFGIRTGNGCATFKKPVVVVGIDEESSMIAKYITNYMDAIRKNLDEIMDTVMDVYYDYCDAHGIDPEFDIVGGLL